MSSGTPTRIFISYSRTDYKFVDRLEADLIARQSAFVESLEAALNTRRGKSDTNRLEADLQTQRLAVWVDRRRIEGGQEWWQEIRSEIQKSDIVLLVLSPNGLDSKWVRKEYKHAIWHRKPLIPLLYHPVSRPPRALRSKQWISFQADMDFENTYPEQFMDLMKAIAALLIPSLIKSRSEKRRAAIRLASKAGAQAEPAAKDADAAILPALDTTASATPIPMKRHVSKVPTVKALHAFDRWMLALSVSIVLAGLAVLGVVGMADLEYHIALSSITIGVVEGVTIIVFTLIGGFGVRGRIYRRGRLSALRRISQGIALALYILIVQGTGVWGAEYMQVAGFALTPTISVIAASLFAINLTISGILSMVTILS